MKWEIDRIKLAAAGLLIMAMFAMAAVPAGAVVKNDLRITSENLAALNSLTYTYPRSDFWYSYSSGLESLLLKYDQATVLNIYDGTKTAVYIGTKKAIKIRNGECVAFANDMANRNSKSSTDWERGRQVMDIGNYGDMVPGTLIATFSSPTVYSGHVAIFDSWHWVYESGFNWKIDGFYVWDQNYIPDHGGVVARHFLSKSSSGLGNANNYYVVKGP